MSNSDPVVWRLADIKEYIDENSKSGRFFIQIPKFQRTIVWKEAKIRMLVDSIYNGFPIGSLLAYQTGEQKNQKVVLQLVDGLQRVTAISRYLENPLKYAPIGTLFSEEFFIAAAENVYGSSTNENLKKIHANIRLWLSEVGEFQYGEKYNFKSLAKFLSGGNIEIETQLLHMSVSGDAALGEVSRKVQLIENYLLQVLIYSGPIENVPTIFERINSQGEQLSKYEILAASWYSTRVAIENVEVKAAISQKYKVLVDSGYEVQGFEDPDTDVLPEYNLYEYLFGLGKVLTKKYKVLFHAPDNDDENSPIAFQIFTVVCQLPVSKMGSLPEHLPRLSDGVINVEAIEKAVFEACDSVSKSLEQYLTLKLNEQNLGSSGVGQNQAISFITSFIANSYGRDFQKKNTEIANTISNNVPAHFLVDVLRGTWGGSGDSTLFERTWENRLISTSSDHSPQEVIVASPHYLNSIDADSLRKSLASWHEDQLNKRQSERQSLPKDIRPVLRFVYSSLVSFQQNKGQEFELEHVYPVSYLKNLIQASGSEGWPISALGNLMLLPKDMNRIKKANLLGDYIESLQHLNQIQEHEISGIQDFLIAPEISKITNRKTIDEREFKNFCELRVSAISEHLIKVLQLKEGD